jgi:CheY-like chemotaxis protein
LRAAVQASTPMGGRRVLVVDDNDDIRLCLQQLIERDGHAVVAAATGDAALREAATQPFDLILCDIGLPDMQGHDVARTLRSTGCRARLVALSGYAQPEDIERAKAAGFDQHLPKPPSVAHLRQLLGACPRVAA